MSMSQVRVGTEGSMFFFKFWNARVLMCVYFGSCVHVYTIFDLLVFLITDTSLYTSITFMNVNDVTIKFDN